MDGYRTLIILDFEATCDDQRPLRPQEIIELPSALVSLDARAVVAEFEAFVRPIHHPRLTRFCRELTSIRQEDVDAAPAFGEVFARHQRWLAEHRLTADTALFVTCGHWDLRTMLPRQCAVASPPITRVPAIYRRWHNVKLSYGKAVGQGRPGGMADMLAGLGLPLEGHHHRGIDDCRNIARICLALAERGVVFDVNGSSDDSPT